jgi:bacteriocin-like protein
MDGENDDREQKHRENTELTEDELKHVSGGKGEAPVKIHGVQVERGSHLWGDPILVAAMVRLARDGERS